MEANNLSGYLITPNQKLKIPNGSTTTPSKTNPSTNNNVGGSGGYSSPTFSHQNLYTAGQCTWYVFDRRSQAVNQLVLIGQMQNIGQVADGYTVDHNATVGSIMQTTTGYYGHVAYVERVNADGSILISEMNYANGPYNTNTRTIPASVVSSYNFIH